MKWTVRNATKVYKKAKQRRKTFGARSRTQIHMQISHKQCSSDWWRMRAGMPRLPALDNQNESQCVRKE